MYLSKFQSFWGRIGPQKGQKTTLKMTFLPLFGHTEAALGDSNFEGSNELQM